MKNLITLLFIIFIISPVFSQQNVSFKTESFDMGPVLKKGGTIKYRFNFTNTTKGTVRVLNALTEALFIDLDWFRPALDRNERGYIQLTIHPEKAALGKYTEKIIVYTSADETSPIVLSLLCEVVNKMPEPEIADYKEYFGILADEANVRSKKFGELVKSIAAYVVEKGSVVLQVESSMSPMTINNYAERIARSRAENIQTEIIKGIKVYNIDSKAVSFSKPLINIQGPVYSKKMQGKSKECAEFQYIKVYKY